MAVHASGSHLSLPVHASGSLTHLSMHCVAVVVTIVLIACRYGKPIKFGQSYSSNFWLNHLLLDSRLKF